MLIGHNRVNSAPFVASSMTSSNISTYLYFAISPREVVREPSGSSPRLPRSMVANKRCSPVGNTRMTQVRSASTAKVALAFHISWHWRTEWSQFRRHLNICSHMSGRHLSIPNRSNDRVCGCRRHER